MVPRRGTIGGPRSNEGKRAMNPGDDGNEPPQDNGGAPAGNGTGGDSPGGDSPGDSGREDIDRANAQIRLIEAALGDDVGVARLPDGSLDYLYVKHVLLVRDAYLGRVQ